MPALLLSPWFWLAALLAIGGAGAGGYYKGDQAGRNAVLVAQHEAEIAALSDAVKEQNEQEAKRKADAARTDALLAARTQTANAAISEKRRYEDLLAKAQMDPAARAWLDARIPDPVWCGLRERPAGVDCHEDGKGAAPGGPGGGDPKPKTAQPDRLRLDHVLAGAGSGPRLVQR